MFKHPLDIHAVVSVDGRAVKAQELGFDGGLAALIEKQHPDMVARIMDHLGLDHQIIGEWGSERIV